MENEIVLGLIKSRHEIPVEEYVLDYVSNPSDFAGIMEEINKRLYPLFSFLPGTVRYINQIGEGEVKVIKADRPLRVYVTGFSPALAALINWCFRWGVELTLMHYSPQEDKYLPQKMRWR